MNWLILVVSAKGLYEGRSDEFGWPGFILKKTSFQDGLDKRSQFLTKMEHGARENQLALNRLMLASV